MVVRLLFISLSISISLCAAAASAQSSDVYLKASQFPAQLRFGAEWTMSSDELLASFPKNGNDVRVETPVANEMVERIHQSLEEKYANSPARRPKMTFKSFHSRWRRTAVDIEYPDSFKMTVFSDPGVLEVNTSPSSLRDIENHLSLIQSDIFDEGKKLGLEPALFTGSGHIHIEVSKLHPVTVRNFLADFYNHTGLAAGGLNEDIYNSLGSGEMPEANKKILREAFEDFDRTSGAQTTDLVAEISKSYSIRHRDDLPEYRNARDSSRAAKYFAVSYKSFSSIGTIEIRSIRPQGSAESYRKLLKLFVARMQLAEKQRLAGHRVAVGAMPSLRGKPELVLADFEKYVTEAGLDFADYREFVLPWWQQPGGEFDKQLAKKSSVPRSCKALF